MTLTSTTFINGTQIIMNTANNATLSFDLTGTTKIDGLRLIGQFCTAWSGAIVNFSILILFMYALRTACSLLAKRYEKKGNKKVAKAWWFLEARAMNLFETFAFLLSAIIIGSLIKGW